MDEFIYAGLIEKSECVGCMENIPAFLKFKPKAQLM